MEAVTQPVVEWGVASTTLGGEARSGDRHLIRIESDFVLIAAVDGLGHGDEAAGAAQTAIRTLESASARSVIALLNRCHEHLLGSRGAVMSLAAFTPADSSITWTGVGNVEGLLLRASPDARPRYESLLLRSGVVGARLPLVHAAVLQVMRGDTLVFATDGLRSDLLYKQTAVGHPQQLADRIMAQCYKGTDDALVLVVRYLGGAP
jgi:negative regulator of sigma-B (phosphoserine phosphatase)